MLEYENKLKNRSETGYLKINENIELQKGREHLKTKLE